MHSMRSEFTVSDRLTKSILSDESGAVLIEFTVVALVFFLMLFGVVEFSNAFFQWNAATKAVQFGARLAAVSDPVASSLSTLTGLEGGALPGSTMPAFDCICNGALGTCVAPPSPSTVPCP